MIDLTQREQEVVERVANGLTNKQIAAELNISMRRVQTIVSAVCFKANLDATRDERIQLALWWNAMRFQMPLFANGIPKAN